MLGTVLERLTSLVSKYFIIGAFIPVLLFIGINGIFLYLETDWFTRFVDTRSATTTRAFDLTVLFFGTAVLAYVVWSLNPFVRQLLEGRHTSWVGRWRKAQRQRKDDLGKQYRDARNTVRYLSHARAGWAERLTRAAKYGKEAHPGEYLYILGPATKQLISRRANAETPELAELDKAVAELEVELRLTDLTAQDPSTQRSPVAAARKEMLILFDYAQDVWQGREIALFNTLQMRFGVGDIATTAFGNVAASSDGYALERYRLNLGTFWSRLQPLLQKQEHFYTVLQDAKAQLDFLTISAFLSGITTMLWTLGLWAWGDSVLQFLLVAVVGAITARLLYLAAVENYVAFGELLRTGLDLYRLELLDALHLPRPHHLHQERRQWEALQGVATYGEEWIDIGYRVEPARPST